MGASASASGSVGTNLPPSMLLLYIICVDVFESTSRTEEAKNCRFRGSRARKGQRGPIMSTYARIRFARHGIQKGKRCFPFCVLRIPHSAFCFPAAQSCPSFYFSILHSVCAFCTLLSKKLRIRTYVRVCMTRVAFRVDSIPLRSPLFHSRFRFCSCFLYSIFHARATHDTQLAHHPNPNPNLMAPHQTAPAPTSAHLCSVITLPSPFTSHSHSHSISRSRPRGS
ncbi:hypothetical protein DENSPDRAFT_345559 [Dentipellis sp. KUC8613]|nr:hypothetical protein DENSPDRAFT_345559 [Dentipellis sp. KUC8613]